MLVCSHADCLLKYLQTMILLFRCNTLTPACTHSYFESCKQIAISKSFIHSFIHSFSQLIHSINRSRSLPHTHTHTETVIRNTLRSGGSGTRLSNVKNNMYKKLMGEQSQVKMGLQNGPNSSFFFADRRNRSDTKSKLVKTEPGHIRGVHSDE